LYFNGQQDSIGGTSWSCPSWAGFCALINQVRISANLPPLGMLGPRIYPLMGSVNLQDITSGTNGYSAGIGYDLVTGCGTPNLRSLGQTLGPFPMTVLHSFGDGTVLNDGSGPSSGLVTGTDGNFYGTTSSGGTAGQGTVYKMKPQGVVTILHNFGDGSVPYDGANPAGVIQASDGNFYGVTQIGGLPGFDDSYYGTIFEMTPQGVLTIIHDFSSSDGQNPNTLLVEGTDGYLYGTTPYGGFGTVFKILPGGGGYAQVHTFGDPTNDGQQPSGLICGSDGNFYGTTYTGGPYENGTVFKMNYQGDLTTLHYFGDGTVPNDGIYPAAALVEGTDNCYYGSTSNGGPSIFKITSQGVMTIIHPDADGSTTPLLLGNDGNFYGTAGGGVNNQGYVFRMTSSGTETVMHYMGDGSVTSIDAGSYGTGVGLHGLVQTPDGTIYGTASGGGAPGDGIAFKLVQVTALNFASPPGTTFTVGYSGSFNVIATGTTGVIYGATGLPSWASLDPSTGVLSGTPPNTTGAPFTINLTLTSGTLPVAAQTFTLNVENAAAPAITGTPLSASYFAGTPYGFAYQATGFPAPAFSLATGQLPPGMTIDPSGLLSGVPTLGGVYTGSIAASNGVGAPASQGFSITVQQQTQLTSAPLNAQTTVGVPYSFTFTASGYPAPTFSIFGQIPPGISLSTSGVLSGTAQPGDGGVYTGSVTAYNAYGQYGSSDSQNYTLTVQEAPAINAGPPFSPAVVNQSYYFNFSQNAYGYPGPTYTLTSGSFPTGLTMSTGGVVTGTATASGTFSGVVTAANGVGSPATKSFVIVIEPPTVPVFTNGLPPNGYVGSEYSFTFQASGLPAPSLSVTSGTVPPGLIEADYELDGPLIWSGVLWGRPTQSGTFSFTVTASNGLTTPASQTYSITVLPAKPAITSALSATGTNGFPFQYQITASGPPATYRVTGLPRGLGYSASNGLISGTPSVTGTFAPVMSASAMSGSDTETLALTILPPHPVIRSRLVDTGTVGSAFNYRITATGAPTSFNATGLPPGLDVSASTGLISGTPTAPGPFDVTISAVNASGTGSATLALTMNLKFKPIAGSYAGLASQGGPNLGLLTVSVTPQRLLTARLTIANASYPFRGTLRADGTFNGKTRMGALLLTSTMAIDASVPDISGTFTATVHGLSQTYSALANLLGKFTATALPHGMIGAYTMVLPMLSATDSTTPNFPGYGTMTVEASGGVAVTGRMGDGAPFAAVGQLDADGKTCAIFSPLYATGNRGSLAGNIVFESSTESDCDGQLDWIRPAQPGGQYYPGGFVLSVDLLSAKYVAPPLQSGTAAFTLGGGNLPDAAITDSLQVFSNNTVTITGSNQGGVTLTLTPATGTFGGKFHFPATGKLTPYGGVIYEKPDRAGYGIFMGTDQSGGVGITP
jgi:uncharacterized repeat protein (TIGR03803 family)